jgi:hypothetical protein
MILNILQHLAMYKVSEFVALHVSSHMQVTVIFAAMIWLSPGQRTGSSGC